MSKLAIYFPGIGYHCDKPLLYYSRSLARELGYQECRNISYTYEGKNIRGDQAKMREAYETLFQQAEKELEEIDWSVYDDILFVSKSIGTIIAASYVKKHGLVGVRSCIRRWLRRFPLHRRRGLPLSEQRIPGALRERSFSWPGKIACRCMCMMTATIRWSAGIRRGILRSSEM